jgi:FSR family fosmidomycin resistance protein-like MFS transporter
MLVEAGMRSNPVLVFACVGHFAVHLLLGLHATAALAIEREWLVDYGTIIALGIWGAFLLGAAAPAAGWLADKVGAAPIMVIFFVGSGAASTTAAMASEPASLAMTLAALGLFGAIYHPVGLAWLLAGVDESRRGWAIGLNGLFGSLGVAAAPAVAGVLGDTFGWRMAFLLPGVVTVMIGILLMATCMRGVVAIDDRSVASSKPAIGGILPPEPATGEVKRALVALGTAMMCGSLLYSAFVTALPKWAEGRILAGWPAADIGVVGTAVAIVFLVGGFGQVLAGYLADRYDSRHTYVLALATKPVLLGLAVLIAGPAGLVAAAALVLMIDIASPSESLLLARWAPANRRGFAFGVRYAAALAATPAGLWLAAAFHDTRWGHEGLFIGLAVLAAVAAVAAAAIPRDIAIPLRLVRRDSPASGSSATVGTGLASSSSQGDAR